jgi:hypothetical protein
MSIIAPLRHHNAAHLYRWSGAGHHPGRPNAALAPQIDPPLTPSRAPSSIQFRSPRTRNARPSQLLSNSAATELSKQPIPSAQFPIAFAAP